LRSSYKSEGITSVLALRSWIKRLERASREGHGRFLMRDGTLYYYDPNKAASDLFVHCVCLMANPEEDTEPPEPEILTAIRRARDPVAVLSRFRADDPERGFVDPLVLLEDAPESHEDGF
jgi:hypothetical protein